MSTTTKAVHTPGPWSNIFFDEGETNDVFAGHEGELLASAYPMHRSPGNEMANARLIAAAPEMLEALERIADLDNAEGITAYQLAEIALAAIQKARGGQ